MAATAISMLVLPLIAQDGTASLTGKVQDTRGEGVAGTLAELNQFQAVADAEGVYRFVGLPAGEYRLKLSHSGFRSSIVKSIHILDGEQRSAPVVQLALGGCGIDGGAQFDSVRFLPSGDNVGNLGGSVRLDKKRGKSMPISGADVTLLCSTGKPCGVAKTDSNGEFQFKTLAPGDFSVRVTGRGFYPEASPSYTVEGGIESTYRSIYIERCHLGNCDPQRRPRKPPTLCE
jgi:hypothetical protein